MRSRFIATPCLTSPVASGACGNRGPACCRTSSSPPADQSGYYATIAVGDHAIECLKDHSANHPNQPFFHYVAFIAPHFPLHALPQDIAKYHDKYLAGWEAMRAARFGRQQEIGLTRTTLSVIERDVGPPYAFPDAIKKLGPGFSSACNAPFRRHKTWVHEGGISTPLIAHWPAGISAKGELRHTPGHFIDIVPTVLELTVVQKPNQPGREDAGQGEGSGADLAGTGRPLHRTGPQDPSRTTPVQRRQRQGGEGRKMNRNRLSQKHNLKLRGKNALRLIGEATGKAAIDFQDSQKMETGDKAAKGNNVMNRQHSQSGMQVQSDRANGFSYTARFFNLLRDVEKKKALFVAGRESSPEVRVNDQALKSEFPSSVTFDGLLTLTYPASEGVIVTRTVYPSMARALVIEEWQVRNTTGKRVAVTVAPARKVKPVAENLAIVWSCPGVKAAAVKAGGVLSFSTCVQARLAAEPDLAVKVAAERGARRALAEAAWSGPGRLETPEPALDVAFALQKFHVLETPIETIKGVITHNGSLTYSPGIWANDPVEYSSPVFPFFGDAALNRASMNMYRVWQDYCQEKGIIPFPRSFEGPGLRLTHRERGDDAMVLYGLSKFLLFQGDRAAAEELWPLIEFSAASVLRHTTAEGIIASETDEMEGRYPTGKANLSTSDLAYGGYRQAARLTQALRKPVAAGFDQRADALRKGIEAYFGAEAEGFQTYRYYQGVGPELSFARRVSQAIKAPTAIIKWAAGGTTLGGDWNRDDPSDYKLCPLALQLIQSSLAELDRRKVACRIEGFMWHQGENDMFSKEFKPNCGNNLKNFPAKWRRDLKTPNLKFYIGELCTKTIWGMDNRSNMYAIRAGQKAVTESDPLAEYIPTSPDDWTPQGTEAKDRNLYPQFIAFIQESIKELQAKDAKGETYARVAPTFFPGAANGEARLVHHITSYNKKALWDSVKTWFDGGAETSGAIRPTGAILHEFTGKGRATWEIYPDGVAKEDKVPLAWNSFATPVAADPNTFGYRWDLKDVQQTDFKLGSRFKLPEYFHLVKSGGKPQWVPVQAEEVPAETGLAKAHFDGPKGRRPKAYVTPDDAASCWKKPGPAAGPFQARLGDGSVVTYYWCRFADQPAILNANLTNTEREALQARVEKLHRSWKKERDYLAPPAFGKLAELDPVLIVTPPPGLEVGYVPIVTRQAANE